MLSYIYRLMVNFEHKHGLSPNLLYINQKHFEHLKDSLADDTSPGAIFDLLKMEMVVDSEVVHPYVVWAQSVSRLAV